MSEKSIFSLSLTLSFHPSRRRKNLPFSRDSGFVEVIGREEKNVFVSFVVRERLRSACFENNKTKVLCPAIGRNVEPFPGTSLSLAETFLGRERIKTWIFPYAREKSVKRQNFFKHTCVCVIVPRGKWIESMQGGREEHSRILWRSSTEKIGRVEREQTRFSLHPKGGGGKETILRKCFRPYSVRGI